MEKLIYDIINKQYLIRGEDMDFKFYMPTKVLFGKGIVKKSIDEIKNYGSKAFIITGKRSSKINGSLDDVESVLKEANIQYIIFDEVEENPSIETVEKAAIIGRENDVNFIIGIGGGSPIDAAKAIGAMIKNKELTGETLFTNRKLESIDIIAVPTTSGTGTETTQYSILTDHKSETKKNLGQIIFPKLSLVDPTYTMDMRIEVTRNTAIDAFSHIVEGYLNINATFITDMMVEKALNIWGECIQSLISGNINYEVREKLMLSSTIAGMIIAQTGTSIPHGMGYALTYFKNIPHGLANGCLYIEYLRVFKNKERVNNIYKYLGLNNYNELEDILRQLTKIEINVSIKELEYYSKSMSENKAKLKNHPEDIGYEQIFNIYKKSLINSL